MEETITSNIFHIIVDNIIRYISNHNGCLVTNFPWSPLHKITTKRCTLIHYRNMGGRGNAKLLILTYV